MLDLKPKGSLERTKLFNEEKVCENISLVEIYLQEIGQEILYISGVQHNVIEYSMVIQLSYDYIISYYSIKYAEVFDINNSSWTLNVLKRSKNDIKDIQIKSVGRAGNLSDIIKEYRKICMKNMI